METHSNNIQLFSFSNSSPESCNNDLTITEAGIKEYESLLYKIATNFGFSDSKAMDIVQQVCSCFIKPYADRQNDTSLKIRLSKVMVHKCIFELSSQLFSQNRDAEKTRVTGMPLSSHAVFILHDIIGFDECEVAEMLNINLHQVKQRHNKALLFIK